MIVTLAGHVDHGKTALVRALTGVDTDRLEIEKKRGLTIELGFAYAEIEGKRIGFVDVPGHRKFIRNMIAGVSRQQFAMLVVAADEGPMPQTAEHLDILETVGLTQGIVVFSRADLADDERRAKTKADTQALLQGSFLENTETVCCASSTGEGLAEVKRALARAARNLDVSPTRDSTYFRLCVDRAFHLSGTGLVVTGCPHSGHVQVGATLTSSRTGRGLRVRGLRVADRDADTAHPGDRTALNVTGIELKEVRRGDWLIAREANQPTQHLSLAFRTVRRLPKSLRQWTSIHVHHGAAHLTGRLRLVDARTLDAGESCLVDCLLDAPIVAKWGDRVLVRDAASESTLGGGPVIDIGIAERSRRTRGKSELLRALAKDNALDSLAAALTHKRLIPLRAFASLRNVPESSVLDRLPKAGIRCLKVDAEQHLTLDRTCHEAEAEVLRRVDHWHQAHPDAQGLSLGALRQESAIPAILMRHVVAQLVASKEIDIHAGTLRRQTFEASRSEQERDLLRVLQEPSNKTPTLGDLAGSLSPQALLTAAKRLESTGDLVFINARRLLHRETLEDAIALAKRLDTPQGFTVRDFRDISGFGRNACIDMLEYLDRKGVTQRLGDRRRVRLPA